MELLVVFVILWFMMYYFVAQGMLYAMPVGFKLDHVYNVTLAIRPSDSPSFIAYEEGSEEPVRNIERIVERIERHPDVEVVGLVLFAALYRLEHRQQSLERLDQPAGAGNDRLAGVFPGVRHSLR